MDRRITIALVAVLLVLGGYIWYTFLREDAPPLTPPTPVPTTIPFVEFSDDQVTTVEIRDVKQERVTRVTRAGDVWKMEQPAQGDADPARVSALVYQLAQIVPERQINPSGDLAGYGLNPAAYQVNLTLADGSKINFEVGGQNPGETYYYARKVNETPLYLISSPIVNEIKEFVEMPPYTPTPSPSPSPTGAATPVTLSATPTP